MTDEMTKASDPSITGPPVRIVVTGPDDPHGIYANLLNVRAHDLDFVLDFAQLLPPEGDEEIAKVREAGVLKVPSKARIILPVSVMPRAITALRQALNEFAARKGLTLPAEAEEGEHE